MPETPTRMIRVDLALYEQIAALARKRRRTIKAELALAVECYLEKAIQGSRRWHELAGEESK